MAMHPEHQTLLDQLKASAGAASHGGFDLQSYHGSPHPVMGVRAPELRRIARAWAVDQKAMPPREVLAVISSLFEGASHDERVLAAVLLPVCRPARVATTAADVESWLDQLNGWAQVDSLCSNVIKADQMLADWPAWEGLIIRLAGDENINKRRAALVLLTGPLRYCDDPRLSALAFATIERLKGEKPILITKAVSWLLRALSLRHAGEVAAYLDAEARTLPAIAVRETRTKLMTGRKS